MGRSSIWFLFEGWLCRTDGQGGSFVKVLRTRRLIDFAFANEDAGIAVESDGFVIGTRDGGRSWLRSELPEGCLGHGLFVATPSIAWIAGQKDRSAVLFVTHDGGRTWNVQRQEANVFFSSASFVDGQTGWLASVPQRPEEVHRSGELTILHTTDGGSRWLVIYNGR
jgi:photosystem II stability/assembly factor-like uncharacterized protein